MPSLIEEDLNTPGIHALVIGVSHYPYVSGGSSPTTDGESFGIGQLSSAARSASEFAGWLLKRHRHPTAKLKSLRVLLSPSDGEQINSDINAILPDEHEATLEAVREALIEFRDACSAHKENIAIVYVAGHGVQLTKHGATVLLHDFGRPGQLNHLECAIDMAGVHAGMNHPNTAQTQFWFIDACRQRPAIASRFESMSRALTLDELNGTARVSPIYLATATGKEAYGKPDGVSLFYEALQWALDKAGAAEGADSTQNTWQVTVNGLNSALPDKVNKIASTYDAEQHVEVTGKIHNAVFHQYKETPEADLTINIDPASAAPTTIGSLVYNATKPVLVDNSVWPIEKRVESGLYQFKATTTSPPSKTVKLFSVTPPVMEQTFHIQPGGTND